MEVFSIITNDKEVLIQLDNFIFNYPKLQCCFKDNNTAYFMNPIDNRNEIYYHYVPIDDKDLFNEFTLSEIDNLKSLFKDTFIIVDLQYRNELFLDNFIKDFKLYLKERRNSSKIIYYHPFKGFLADI